MREASKGRVLAIAAAAVFIHVAGASAQDHKLMTPDASMQEPATAGYQPGIRVVLNHAKVVKLSAPASTVIVGNPEIADTTVQDPQTLVLTGRGFGSTNLVILDAGGNPILDERVAVTREDETLRIYRQAEIDSYSCQPFCEKAYLTEAEIQSIRAIAEANDTGD